MDCWITLGIEEYSDKKAIKMAYAKLLKVTKPDDDPQGFKELHTAYKEALELVSEYKEPTSPQWFTPPEKNKKPINFDEDSYQNIVEVTNAANQKSSEPSTSNLPNSDDNDDEEVQTKLEEDWNYLVSQTNEIIQKESKNTIIDWQFLEDIPSMLDLEFRSQASDRIFDIVSEANEISLEQKTLLVKQPTLDYLNVFFHWESNWKYYEQLYGERVNTIFPYLAEGNVQPITNKERCENEERFVNWFVDDFMPENLTEDNEGFDEEMRRKRVKHGLGIAIRYGFFNKVTQTQFIALMWRFGPHFYLYPGFKPITLNSQLSGTEKIDQYYECSDSDFADVVIKDEFSDWFMDAEESIKAREVFDAV